MVYKQKRKKHSTSKRKNINLIYRTILQLVGEFLQSKIVNMDYVPLNRTKKQLCSNKYVSLRSRSSSDSSTDSSSSSSDSSSSSESESTSSSSFSSSTFTTSSSSDRNILSSSTSSTTSSRTSSSTWNVTLPDSISTRFGNSVPVLRQSCDISTTNSLQKPKRDEHAKDLKIVFKPLKLSRLSSPKNEDSSTSKGCRIYVGHLTHNVTKEHLREIFSKYGIIKELDLPLDVFTKSSKGFSYIEYSTPVEALTALRQMNGGQIDGHEIICMPVPSSMRVGRNNVNRKIPMRNYRKMPTKQQSPPHSHGSASQDYSYSASKTFQNNMFKF